MLRRAVALTAAAVVLAGCTPATGTPEDGAAATVASGPDDRLARSEALLADVLDPGEPGCSVAVGVDGEVVWAAARGLADVRTGRPLTTDTSFDVVSVGKQFTATAVLLLEQDGVLALADPVSRWLPGLPAWAQEVTLDHLVHHTSGIPDYLADLEAAGFAATDVTTQEQALQAIAGHAELPEAEGFAYSNSNYVLLAEVVRAASGQSLADFLAGRVFEPLGLAMAVDPTAAAPDAADPSSARGHVKDTATGPWRVAGSRWQQVGDGAVRATASDLVRWADEYRTSRLGGEELLAARLADPAPVNGERDYAAGITVTSGGALEHRGGWAGFASAFRVSADRHTAVAVTCNGDEPGVADVERLWRVLPGLWL
ncbi:serine hydrolase domain-containing protein [Geodermatophilus sp. FMUSA9-8]|uniref:serine hydrolase domain-containing protein n=1 Tax=Geodermatophilus sp. FMUSA9-8 TaxID=3120155 RepID=UPI00300938F1